MSDLEGYGKIYESTWWGVGRDNNISWGDVYATLGGAPLLDTYTGAIAAYSLRKLSSSYSGDAIVVTTDGVDSQTIGFSGNDLDTATLESFAGRVMLMLALGMTKAATAETLRKALLRICLR